MVTTPKRIAQEILGPILVALALAILPAPVHAHAQLEGSAPATDALLDALPEDVTLRFSEPVGVTAADWLLPGEQRSPAKATATPGGLSISAPPDAGRGTSALDWRVVSADGHPVGGALVFSVGEITGGAEPDVNLTDLLSILVSQTFLFPGGSGYVSVVNWLLRGLWRDRFQGRALDPHADGLETVHGMKYSRSNISMEDKYGRL